MARVLIVDDHALNAELAAFVLQQAGIDVRVAADAEQALVELARERPDLVLMDIQLPGIDGLALTRRIRSEPAWQSIVVVAMTAFAMKGDSARFLEAGCNGYLSKPIDVETFASEVLAHLD